MVRALLTKASGSVTAAAAILAVASFASRAVGVMRDRMLSGAFGAGPELDAYYAAFRLPDTIFNLFVLGAITAGFIPVFTKYIEKGGEEASRLTSLLLSMLGAILVGFATVGAIFAPQLVAVFTPGFDAAGRDLTVSLTRVMLLSPFFLGLSSVLGGVLQTRRRFLIYALAPILYNVGIIGGIVILVPTMGVQGVAVGVVIGAFLHFAVQLAACYQMGWRYRFAWNTKHEGVREIVRMAVPRTAGLAVSQINLLILTGMASTVGAGGIAVFTLANNLQTFPVGIIGVSFAVAAFPFISALAAQGKTQEFVDQLSKTVRTILFLVIPSTVALLLLRAQIVRVVLGTGRFDWPDTIATADTLAFFSLSLFAQALAPLVARAFFAFHDVVPPLIAAVASVIVERVLAAIFLAYGLGTPGLALSFSIGSILNFALLWVMLHHRIGDLAERAVLRSLLFMSGAAMLMALAMQVTKVYVGGMVDMQTGMGIFTQGLSAGLIGIAVYVGVAYMMGSEEARDVMRMYKRRIVPQPGVSGIAQEEGNITAE